MAKCYQLDPNGFLIFAIDDDGGFLPAGAIYADAPPAAVEGMATRWTGETWEQVESHKGKSGYLDGDLHTIHTHGPLPDGWSETPPPPSLEEAKAQKWGEIVAGQATAMAVAKAAYPDDEREGWPFKLPEAETVLAGQDIPTPYLDAELAGAGGLYQSKEELAQKIMTNNLAFKALHGFVTGQQAAMYHALNALAGQEGVTSAEVLAMPVTYTMPEDL